MAEHKQIDCFNINMKFWKLLGVWPATDISPHYRKYSIAFITIFIILYELLNTINFFFLSRQLDSFVEEMIFYFTNLSVFSKALTFFFGGDRIMDILATLESDIFQSDCEYGRKIIGDAKKFNSRYWKTIAVISYTSHLTHALTPLLVHFVFKFELELPVCSYSFLSEQFVQKFVYPLYFYQSIGMHFHLLFNLNVDTFFLGIMVLLIAQLDILYCDLQNVTENSSETANDDGDDPRTRLKKSFVHFEAIVRFCELIQKTFSVTLFVQFSMASCIICICLFRFTLPAPLSYRVFLATYMTIMVVQILVPCWFGTRIMNNRFLKLASAALSTSIYNSDWTPCSKLFKSSLRIFVERVKRPLSLIGGKMFPLSLETFTSIMNSAYSFFTLLRHMQSREH